MSDAPPDELPVGYALWAVLLIIAVIVGLIGYRVLKRGIPPVPTESIDSLKRDVRAIKGIGKRSTP